jgi:hypothetical protein
MNITTTGVTIAATAVASAGDNISSKDNEHLFNKEVTPASL